MENEPNITKTQLLKLLNDTTTKHVKLKEDITKHLDIITQYEKIVNEKLGELKEVEDTYIEIVSKLNNLNNGK